jgi:hypothetical protein
MRELRIPALQIKQGTDRRIYSFGIDAKLLHRFATVSRVSRDEGATLHGYQRPEVVAHISAIRAFQGRRTRVELSYCAQARFRKSKRKFGASAAAR